MPQIILASRSAARKKLLRQIGLKFSVAVPSIEEQSCETGDCRPAYRQAGRLVVRNAVLKAHSVGARFRSGIIIAADTIVAARGKILGKPRSRTQARQMLKTLSRRPQWVYTGIAVMDVFSQKVYTACERTKVYLASMSDAQITHYLKKVPSLDKAGAFDIQSMGSVFVRRIEGCYSNIVGLPLSTLSRLLKRVGVDIPHGIAE
jgi:septum formation protein